MKLNIKYIIVLIVCVLLLIIVEISRPRPLDWSQGFSLTQKKPYGSFIVFQILDQIFHQKDIRVSKKPIYNTVNSFSSDSTITYMFLNDRINFNKFESDKLIEFVKDGNIAFLSANSFHGALADTLKLESDFRLSYPDTIAINLTNPLLIRGKDYLLKPNEAPFYFSGFDTANTTILGKNKYNQVNFLKVKFGKGKFYISCVPIVYTNYYLLYMDVSEYIAGSFSYLSSDIIVWDEYYKKNKRTIETPLRFVLSNEALSWAYYLMLSFFILFIIFKSKRVQRIIPVIKPLKNTSIEFISIISKLYLKTKDHTGIARKRVLYLLDFIRSKYLLDTSIFSKDFLHKLSGKSGISLDFLDNLFKSIQQINSKNIISEKELVNINHKIDQFYKRVNI